MKKIYVVDLNGIMEHSCGSLTHALRFIGQEIKGSSFGCLTVTVAEAMAAGYSIRTC